MGFPKDDIYSQLQVFLYSSRNFGLLSPEKMRMPSKNNVNSIGLQGRSLAAFVHKMPDAKKQELNAIISDLLGIQISIKTLEDPGFGVILLAVAEHFSKTTHIDSSHISDGLLRIIAFAAMKLEIESLVRLDFGGAVVQNQDGSVMAENTIPVRNGYILLDEIENGINPYLAEKIIGLLRDMIKKSERQIIVTTHSPIILNEFKPEEIIFLWKDETGASHCGKMFATEKMRYPLNALSPGEIWVNLEKEQILERMGVN
jgi:predicted ATPase